MELVKAPRPKVIGGLTVKVVTGCGPLYIQMNWCGSRLFEVFATLGKTGGCAISQSEALTRSVTMGLRHGVPLAEYIRQLEGIRCPNPMPFPKEEAVWSCADALAKTLKRYGTLSVEGVVKLIQQTNESVDETLTEEQEKEQAKECIAQLAKEREEQGL